MIELSIPLPPVAKGRPRMTKAGIAYTPAKTRNYEQQVATFVKARMQGTPPLQGPVSVYMRFLLPIPPSWNKAKKEQARNRDLLPASKPDLDNLVKAVVDACNGITWLDDSQIVHESASKLYSDNPGIVMVVSGYGASNV